MIMNPTMEVTTMEGDGMWDGVVVEDVEYFVGVEEAVAGEEEEGAEELQ